MVRKSLPLLSYLLNKYLNGGITLLFSYKQLNLMFSGDLKKIHIIIKMLIGVLLISLIGVFFKDFIIFAIIKKLFHQP